MISKVFGVFDSKAGAFMAPFFLTTTGMGVRVFADAARDPQTNVGKNPEDYSLFEFGTFDDSNGSFKLLPSPVSIALAIQFVSAQEPEAPSKGVDLFPNGARAPNGQGV